MAAIIFDFDGTIADSFETIVEIFHELTGREERLSAEAIERLRGMSLRQAAAELGVRPWKMPLLVMLGRRRMGKRIAQVRAHPGMPETTRKLYAEGHQLFIMSSNSEKNIRRFLEQHHMAREFVNVYGGVGLLSKAGTLRKIRRRNHLGSDSCWYVGDEVRDIESAKLVGVKNIAVAWGFNTSELLDSHQPTVLVNSPHELLQVLEEA